MVPQEPNVLELCGETKRLAVSQPHAFLSRLKKRDGKYVFRVPPGVTSARIEISADMGIGIIAIYHYGKKKQ